MPAPVLSSTPTVLAAWFCPFAQRTLIACNAKQPSAAFTFHEISHEELYSKPDWFLALNPAGLIPVIAWQQQQQRQQQPGSGDTDAAAAAPAAAGAAPGVVAIRESLICNEFLEDAHPAPPRTIIARFSDAFVPAFYRLLVQQAPEAQAAAAATLDRELAWLLRHMAAGGPLAAGPQLSLLDCAVAPFLLRLYVLEHYRQYVYRGDSAERLERYLQAAAAHPAVAATTRHPEPGKDYRTELLASYARYADGSADSLMARDAKQQGGGGAK